MRYTSTYSGIIHSKGLIYGTVKKVKQGTLTIGDKEFEDRIVEPLQVRLVLYKGKICRKTVKCDPDGSTIDNCIEINTINNTDGTFRFEVPAGIYTLLVKHEDKFIVPDWAQDEKIPWLIVSEENYIPHHIDILL